ncbi:histidine triad (HIT) family protein [Stackebrandtia endophytica]|uniref:Histidine triad (HIT) family protein n=2 Tax=Stackebrandtia endophytica TaxID=1496996 RepID=A0A543APX7_9ACTN|nr:histidine triad (HIT) family protein [Stackebrandtia endophytica]
METPVDAGMCLDGTMSPTHEPPDYDCPFCCLISGDATGLTNQRDVVRRTSGATAIMSPHWWLHNPAHVIVVPNTHHENLYDLPAPAGHAVSDLVREMAVALRHVYDCEGITTNQNNEPAGYQDVWHFHVHVLPRYRADGLYRTAPQVRLSSVDERAPYLDRLADYFAQRS